METGSVAQVYDVGFGGAKGLAEGNGFGDGLVGVVFAEAEAVHDEEAYALKKGKLGGGHGFHVRDIGHVTDAVAQDGKLSVKDLQGGDGKVAHGEAVVGLNAVQLQLGDAGIDVAQETIGQALLKVGGRIVVGIEGQKVAVAEGTEVVYAPNMIVVLVGDEAGINLAGHANAQHLLTEVGTTVDEYAGGVRLNQG